MTTPFDSTLRSLERQGRVGLGIAPTLVLLAAWCAWMIGARVDEYTTSRRARLEVSSAVSRAAASEGGRVVAIHAELGQLVSASDLLAELDDSAARARLDLERAELAAVVVRSAALHAQADTERARQRVRAKVDALASKRASLGVDRAAVAATHEGEVARIAVELEGQMLASRVEALQADRQLRESQIALSGASAELERLRAEQEYESATGRAKLEQLSQRVAELDAEAVVRRTRIAAAEAEIERRRVRAPIAGRLGSVAAIQVGDVVSAGDVIATVVPNAEVRVIAELPPERAIGRVVAGQSARVRLDGFSWLQYGTLEAAVEHVASEPHAGGIRVELVLAERPGSEVPIQHGLTGAVDIRTGRSAPWELVARHLGAKLVPVERAESGPTAARSEARP